MKSSNEEHLINIACKDYDLDKAKESFNQFIRFFDSYIKGLAYYKGSDTNMRRVLYSLFLIDIWEKAELYDNRRSKEIKEEDIRIKKWLSSRMRLVLRVYWYELSKDSSDLSLHELQSDTYLPMESEETYFDDVDIDANKLKIAMIAGKILKKRECEILRITYEFKGEIPKDIRSSICKYWKISDSTIRSIRRRALAKIKKYVKVNNLVIK